jgi:hypothetical protein
MYIVLDQKVCEKSNFQIFLVDPFICAIRKIIYHGEGGDTLFAQVL